MNIARELQLPGYTPLELLGETHYSSVYRARPAGEASTVIIKLIRIDDPSPATIARFRHEYELIRGIDIEGVIKILNFVRHEGRPALVLEDFGGVSLKEIMKAGVPMERFLSLAIRMAEILAALHQVNVTHHDIKPSNILLNPQADILKITDFGISSDISQAGEKMNHPAMIEGTLAYISPEQTGRMNAAVDYRTDFYSLGVTFYEMLTGRLPFRSRDPLEIIHAHIAQKPLPPRELSPDIPVAVSDIVMKLLAKPADERYQNGLGLARDLKACLDQLRSTGRITPFPPGAHDRPPRLNLSRHLVGRGEALEALKAKYDRVSRGPAGMVLVTGEAGIGKSALVKEFRESLAGCAHVAAGKFDPFQNGVPYSGLIQAFQGLIRQLLAENDEQLRAWQGRLGSALGPNGKVIAELIPEIERIIGRQPDLPQLNPAETRNRFHLAFQRFVRVFTDQRRPLALFLDDLQWADAASIDLLKALLADQSLRYLLFVGACRESDIPRHHPLALARDAIEASAMAVQPLHLEPLDPAAVQNLIAAATGSAPGPLGPLAAAVHTKTRGNPFFIHQFLQTLVDKKVLACDPVRGWTWDLSRIEAEAATENVVALMAEKLHELPPAPLEVLRLCALTGDGFTPDTLAALAGRPVDEVIAHIHTLMQEGLIIRAEGGCRFQHERVREAAYSLLSASEREAWHYRIGMWAHETALPETRPARLFFVCDQLNQAAPRLRSLDERTFLARLNLQAGIRAKASAAPAAAAAYLEAGRRLLPEDAWQTDYDLAYGLFTELMECRYLTQEFEEAERLFDVIIRNAATRLDKARAYNTMIVLYTTTRTAREAIALGVEALGLFGIELNAEAGAGAVLLPLIRARREIKKTGLERILDLPPMQEREKIAVHELLLNLGVPAFYANPNLLALVTLKGVSEYPKHGLPPHAGVAYITLANIVRTALGDYDLAYRIGRMALKLNDTLDNRQSAAMVLHTFAFFIQHWKRHVRFDLEIYPRVLELSLDTGNVLFAANSIRAAAQTRLMLDHRLDEVLEELHKYRDFIALLKDSQAATEYRLLVQWIMTLMGSIPLDRDLAGEGFDLDGEIERFRQKGTWFVLCALLDVKVKLRLWQKRFEDARRAAAELDRHVKAAAGTLMAVDHHVNYSLALIALLQQGARQPRYKALIRRNLRRLRRWARFCPENFQHKHDLAAAGLEALKGRFDAAVERFHAAIDGASKHSFLADEAMACQLLADLYLSRNRREEAGVFLRRAHRLYGAWGATAKAEGIQQAHPALAGRERDAAPRGDTHSGTTASESAIRNLDFATVMKVSQVISREIRLDRLLKKTMRMSITNAGAQRGCLVFESDGRLIVEASRDMDTGENRVLQAVPVDACEELSPSIVNYVYHSGQDLILGNASEAGAFRNDPHVLMHRCKSILCMPIDNKGKFTCILYMENNLTADAFTPDRLDILRVISAQAAISLQNALLYENISREVAVRQQAEEDLRASEARYRTILEEMQDAYCEIDPAGGITFVNPAACHMTGYPRDELIGSDIKELIRTEERKDLIGYFREIHATGVPGKPLDCTLVTKNRERLFLEIVASPMRAPSGDIIGFRNVGRDVSERRRLERDLVESTRNVQAARSAVILGLAKLAEYRDEDTGAHLERIREYARIIARELATMPEYRDYITEDYIEDIYNSAILHDIGKVGVPDAVLLKPGKLTPEEFEVIKTHAALGGNALEAVEKKIDGQTFLTLSKEIAHFHHEKWDGTGYPMGLKGEAIPLSARIVALADVYDALTSRRIYKEAFPHERAVEIIQNERGTHFAPDVVDAFIAHAEDFRRIREKMYAE